MKSERILLFIGLILTMFFTSCKDDFFNYDDKEVVEGLPANVILKFKSLENTVVTRAGRDSIYENRVDNIYVFIFDSQGNVHARKFCTPSNGLSYATTDVEADKYRAGTISIVDTKSLNKARIVGIANVSVEGVTSTAYTVTEAELNKITSFDELNSKVMKMTDNSIERYAIFMMTGTAKDDEGNASVTIPGTESGTATLECTLELERTDAKVKFVVATENPDPTNYKDFSFSPRSWVVKRVPSQTYILPQSAGDYNGEDAEYFTSLERPFEVITRDETNPKLDAGGSFVFYMPENRKTPKISITEIENADYALREKWEKEDTQGDKIFTNANDNSTYVEITGLLSYYNADGQNTNADVRFIVHLGDPNENGDGSYDVNNYNTNRNTFYTYNIKIRGVNDIKVEVEQDNEVRPGYEGDVVDTEKRAFIFDSHYDRCLIELNPSSLPAEGEGDIYWSINTPFSRGVHTVTDAEVEENLRDYRWIKFAVNAEYGVPKEQYVKYPGDQNYKDPYPFSGQENDKSSPYYDYSGEGHSAGHSDVLDRDYDSANARLLDINQLMKYLRELKNEGISKEITITVFVDENLYFRHPITGEENVTEDGVRSLWKLTSDKEDRILYLVIQKPQYSDDGNSSVVKAEYSFRQRTIRTIFDVDKEGLDTAWGLESVMETGRLKSGDVSKGTDTRNGRANCLQWLVNNGELEWNNVLNVTGKQYELQGKYNNAAYACLLRNRDLNGDNIVDANEVRWYLASIDQLTDIYLGEYALDEQSRLYPSNSADRDGQTRWHYTSSSSYGSGQSWILWAEEGASRGGSGGSIKDDGSVNDMFSYRCVRNLGISLDNPAEIPTDLVKVEDEGNGYCLIDMTNMNVKARRTSYVTKLPNHDERSDVNRPYAKFRVHKDLFSTPVKPVNGGKLIWPWSSEDDTSWEEANKYSWEYYQTADLGHEGYRIPNQRELLIMTSRMIDSKYWPTYTVTAEYWYWDNTWNYFDANRVKGFKTFYECKPQNYVCISQTAFSMYNQGIYKDYYNKDNVLITRQGFLWTSENGGVFFLQNNKGETGWVRPVQDVR